MKDFEVTNCIFVLIFKFYVKLMNQFFKAAFNVFFTKKHFKMYFFKGLFQNFDKNDSTKFF